MIKLGNANDNNTPAHLIYKLQVATNQVCSANFMFGFKINARKTKSRV